MEINYLAIYCILIPIEKLFLLFLLIAVCFALARAIQLARKLWAFSQKKEFLNDETTVIELLVNAALKGRLNSSFKSSGSDEIDRESALFRVDCVETRFLHLWETCYARVQSIRTLTFLTAILSSFVALMGILSFFNALNLSSLVDISGGIHGELMILAAGFLVSAFFYVLSQRFEGTLARRRRDWNYLKALFREELYVSRGEDMRDG
jgi:hypothetical protein